jgi:hypothetical protein
MKADDDHHDRDKVQRYYDKDRRDWHEWNDSEARAYRYYLEHQHIKEVEWRRMNHRQQLEYWRWRHNNPDHVIFKLDIH